MSHLFVGFVALVIQGGGMAKFWPLYHYNQCMGENRRKTLSTARGRRGLVNLIFSPNTGWNVSYVMVHVYIHTCNCNSEFILFILHN